MKSSRLPVERVPSGSLRPLIILSYLLGLLRVEASYTPSPDPSASSFEGVNQEVTSIGEVSRSHLGVTTDTPGHLVASYHTTGHLVASYHTTQEHLSTIYSREDSVDSGKKLLISDGGHGKFNLKVDSDADGDNGPFMEASRPQEHLILEASRPQEHLIFEASRPQERLILSSPPGEASEDVREVLGAGGDDGGNDLETSTEGGMDAAARHHPSKQRGMNSHNKQEITNETQSETENITTRKEVNEEASRSNEDDVKWRFLNNVMKDNRKEKADDEEIMENEEGLGRDSNQSANKKSEWFKETEAVNMTIVPIITHLSPPTHAHAHGNAHTHTHAHGNAHTHAHTTLGNEEVEALLTVEFLTEEHHITLDLHPSRDLFGATYTEPDDAGGWAPPAACEYQGAVRGVAGSWVALSLCGTLRGVVVGGGQELLVDPAPGASTLKEPHRILSASLLNNLSGTCGVRRGSHTTRGLGRVSINRSGKKNATHEETRSASLRGRRESLRGSGELWGKARTRFIELVVVADRTFQAAHGLATRHRCRTIVNIVNAVFRQLGIVVVLVHLEVLTTESEVQILPDFEKSLDNLRLYRQKLLKDRTDLPNDNTVLLTTVDFNGNTVGYASVSGMCSDSHSVAVVQDKMSEEGVVAQTLAHEMGHNLGMQHDEDSEGCSCDTLKCIMNASGSSRFQPNITWSSCSREYLAIGMESGTFDCLKNVPTKQYRGGSTCGDGVVDVAAGEQCDCGPPEFCDNRCCVAGECKLATNASCASGSCCDTQTCHPKREGDLCREARTSCDLPEYCPGQSEYCPDDVLVRDGTTCRDGKGHCYQGECGSHEGRCQQVWGHGASVAAPRCYSRINKKGGSDGNCGFSASSTTGLLACATQDAACGTLHCGTPLTDKPQLQGSYTYGHQTQGAERCYYIIASSSFSSSTWLTPDGAACGHNMMCVKQRCREIPALEGVCRDGCSGRGVCNSLDHCHCNTGFAPPDCSGLGRGGSYDSGPTQPTLDVNPLVEAAYILCLLLVAVVVIVCCLWSRLSGWWELSGRASCSPCCAACVDACCCPLMNKLIHWILTVQPLGKKKQNSSKELSQSHEETNKMICQVDLGSSWGVVDGVTLTPTGSPDVWEQDHMPSHSPLVYHKSAEELDHPTYLQSISVDSGCVADVEDAVERKAFKSQMSMTSLITTFRRIGSRSSKHASVKEKPRSKAIGSQKSMPLSRFVVDPLIENRRSRQGTPPPDHLKPGFRRSVSTDVTFTPRGKLGGAPLPPPTKLTPHKSAENLISASKVTNSPFIQLEKENKPAKKNKHNSHSGETQTSVAKPLAPPNTSPRITAVRGAPPPPPRTPPSGDHTRRPLMPPVKGKAASINSKLPAEGGNSGSHTQPMQAIPERKADSSPSALPKHRAGPLMPPTAGPPALLNTTAPSKALGSKLQSVAQERIAVHPSRGRNVKDIARRLEQS